MYRFRRFMDRYLVNYERCQKIGWDLHRADCFDRFDNDVRVHRVVANRFAMVRSRQSRALRSRIGDLKRRQHRPRLRGCFGDLLFVYSDRKTIFPIRQCDPEGRHTGEVGDFLRTLRVTDRGIAHGVSLPIPC